MTDFKEREKSQVYQYDTSIETIGGDLLNFKRLLENRNPEKWDYQVDGFRSVPTSVHELDKIPGLVHRNTKEVQIRVYFGVKSNNCVTYIYKFAPQTPPQIDTPLFGGLGGLTAQDALQKHNQHLRLEWESQDKDRQIAQLQAQLKDVEGKHNKSELLLAQAEESVGKLTKQLASPVPPVQAFFASLAGGVMDKVAEFSGAVPPQATYTPPPQGFGNVPHEDVQEAIDTMKNLAEDFGENMNLAWELLGAVQKQQPYLRDLIEFTEKYAYKTRVVIQHFDEQSTKAE